MARSSERWRRIVAPAITATLFAADFGCGKRQRSPAHRGSTRDSADVLACNKWDFGCELRTADTRLKGPQHERSDRNLYTADITCISVVVRNSDPHNRGLWLHGTWLRENHARAGELYDNSACAGNARTWLVGLGDNSRRAVRRLGCFPGCLHTDRQHTDGNRAVRGDIYGPSTERVQLNQIAVCRCCRRAFWSAWI